MCSGNGASSIAIQILIGGLALLRRSVCPLVSVDTKIDGHRAMRYYCLMCSITWAALYRSEGFPLTAYLGPWACCRTRPGEFQKLVPASAASSD